MNNGRNESPAPSGTPHSYDPFSSPNPPPQARAPNQTNVPNQPSSLPQSSSHSQLRDSGVVGPNIRSPKITTPAPSDQPGLDRAANLLNLLKFNQATSTQGMQSSPQSPGVSTRTDHANIQAGQSTGTPSMHTRGISASDLVASSMGRPMASVSRENASPSPMPVRSAPSPAPQSTANPQDFLLQLLSRPKPTQTVNSSFTFQSPAPKPQEVPIIDRGIDKISQDLADTTLHKEKAHGVASIDRGSAVRNDSPIRIFGSSDSREPTPFEPQTMTKSEPQKEPMFTYVNPFEQLTASLPRNDRPRSGTQTPNRESNPSQNLKANGAGKKQKTKASSPGRAHSSSRKITPGGSEIMQSIESAEHPLPSDRDRSRLEALMGIGAPTNDAETVAEALNEVGEQVGRQLEHALSRADDTKKAVEVKQEDLEEAQNIIFDAVEEGLQETAAEVKEELEKDENKGILEETMPELSATAIKNVIGEAAKGNVDGGRGSADDETSPVNAEDEATVPVYNFPMKPFVSIDLNQHGLPTQSFREDAVMAIARLKKDFDQIDRILATASNDFIVYALPKSGGLRIIRQEDGMDRQIFKETRDRIFNVSISIPAPGSTLRHVQTFIATAVSGAVYWAPITQATGDCIQDESLESKALAFPPIPAHDSNTSGGQLKTRAKKSSRHPEFFAIGRGKSIQIVFPMHARASNFVASTFTVDTEKYFSDRSLKINTGKAGKDFVFSEDDSVIVSLDKAGRLRFWDIRDLINEANGTASKIAPIEVKAPVLAFSTANPSEKSWPTSVLFVDKTRPYAKGIALRYVIVGMKQNHTLQLWDLGLGKAVQELNFPHEKESDAICSVSYHAASGLVVVGHPTRNSIYIIHLSAPKYNLPPMSQAKYVTRLANKDSTLPRPEATAIMSGMREYSFASKGQLRSVDLLPMSSDSTRITDDEDPSLFELYVMHSKGVTCLNIKKEDIGWSKESKVLNPVDAETNGTIVVRDLRETQAVAPSEPSSVNGDTTSGSSAPGAAASKGAVKETSHKSSITSSRQNEANMKEEEDGETSTTVVPHVTNGSAPTEKSEKRKKKRAVPPGGESAANVPPPAPVVPDSYAAAAQRARSPSTQAPLSASQGPGQSTRTKTGSTGTPELVNSATESKTKRVPSGTDSISLGISSEFLDKELKKIEKSVSEGFTKVLGKELDALYRRFDEDKRVQDAAGAAKQDAILRLVSSTLTENVDKALARIISNNIQQVVLPSIADVAASTLITKLPEWLTQQLLHILPAQLKLALPEAVTKAVQTPDVTRVISDQVSLKIGAQVEKQFSTILHQTITPAFQNLALGAAQKMNTETERRVSEQIKQVDLQHGQDAAKIDQLTALVRGLSETVHTMAAAQGEFQSEILKLQQSLRDRRSSADGDQLKQLRESSQVPSEASEPLPSPEKLELDRITASMTEGNYEDGTIQVRLITFYGSDNPNIDQWLQSTNQAALFDNFFVKCNPEYLQQCQTLVALSVSAAVTATLETNIAERLHWLETIFAIIDTNVSGALLPRYRSALQWLIIS